LSDVDNPLLTNKAKGEPARRRSRSCHEVRRSGRPVIGPFLLFTVAGAFRAGVVSAEFDDEQPSD